MEKERENTATRVEKKRMRDAMSVMSPHCDRKRLVQYGIIKLVCVSTSSNGWIGGSSSGLLKYRVKKY
jgi:hypothetical protein